MNRNKRCFIQRLRVVAGIVQISVHNLEHFGRVIPAWLCACSDSKRNSVYLRGVTIQNKFVRMSCFGTLLASYKDKCENKPKINEIEK